MLNPADWLALWLSIKLAAISTGLLLLVGIPLARWLSSGNNRIKIVVSALVTLPLILPPSVLGFYLLLSLGPQGPIGQLCNWLGIGLLPFSFNGLVVASLIYSLPFVVQPLQNTFQQLGRQPQELAKSLGATRYQALTKILIPEARAGIICSAVLGFAHTMGEFGMVLMIGGNIPGSTQVVAVQIYNHVEAFEYHDASVLSAILLIFSFTVLIITYLINHNNNAVINR